MDIKKLDNFFQNCSADLKFIVTKSKLLQQLNIKVLPLIEPKNIRAYCEVGNLQKNKLVLFVANGSIATHLKYQVPILLERCKQYPELKNIMELQIKIKPFIHIDADRAINATPELLSTETANLIRNTAISLKDNRLSEIMHRIGNRVKK